MEFKKLVENVTELMSSYLQSFIGIITAPKLTFNELLEASKPVSFNNSQVNTKPIVYAAISTAIGLLMASSLSVKGAPGVAGDIMIQTVATQLFLWIIYALAIHYVAKGFGGQGTIRQSISGVLYVLGTLHPLLILCIYLLSSFFPDFLTYDLTLRRVAQYGGFREFYKNQLNLFGLSLVSIYWAVSFLLTMIYLYFPLKIAHKLSFAKIIFLYFLGFTALVLFILITVVSFLMLGII